MNRTPHVVGNGIGSVRIANNNRRIAERKAAQRAATIAALRKIAESDK